MRNTTRMGLIVMPILLLVCLWAAAKKGRMGSVIAASEKFRLAGFEMLGWLFIGVAVLAVLAMLLGAGMLGRIKIGGPDALPRLAPFECKAVGVAASTSIGLLFWASAEPLFHARSLPGAFDVMRNSLEAQVLGRSAAYLHWGILAHLIYGMFMIGFAITVHTQWGAPSLDTVLSGPRFGKRLRVRGGLMDGASIGFGLLALVAGLAGGALVMSALMSHLSGTPHGGGTAAIIVAILAILAVMIGARPVSRSYAALACAGLTLLYVFLLALFILGPSKGFVLGGGLRALWWSIKYSPQFMIDGLNGVWSERWTIVYLGGWMTFGPLVGYFMSRAARGYSLANALRMFVFAPMFITILTILIIGGVTLAVDRNSGGAIWVAVQGRGPDDAIVATLSMLRGSILLKCLLLVLITLFLVSFAGGIVHSVLYMVVPGDDANRRVIADRRAGLIVMLLLFAGAAIAAIRWNMVPGIEALARLGAFPGVIITLLSALAVLSLCFTPASKLAPPKTKPDAGKGGQQGTLKLEYTDDPHAVGGSIKRPPRRDP